jgi:hypothetical protein
MPQHETISVRGTRAEDESRRPIVLGFGACRYGIGRRRPGKWGKPTWENPYQYATKRPNSCFAA